MIWFFIFFFAILGLFVGSWIGTVAFRLAEDLPLRGKATCRVCLEPVATADLIPVLSYVRLHGRCRSCSSVIGWHYPMIELVVGVVFAVLAARTLFAPDLWFTIAPEFVGGLLARDLIATAFLVLLFAYDAKKFVVPDRISIPAIILVILMNIVLGIEPLEWILGGLIGALFFGIQYLVSAGALVGAGDIRAGALVGVILGFPGGIEAIVGAYVLACLVAIPLFLTKKVGFLDKAPFVSFLAVSTIILLCIGPVLHTSFLTLFG